ncbi:2-alkenal reductase (NADP(+)-dependent)-like [Vigna umbellata]|uniref:2-alkenal reductase (NADP(+)-dependent)-like n=1 Tax=Vigna umbellata TaxID=87088 RepID=UPI001F5F8D2E|nr:2-alkenal reductase (NADP(+)-dependent)-like [Vigna umbellata]
MRIFGRVAVCGVISEYSSAGRKASPNMLDIVYKRISIRGFLAADFLNVFEDFFSKTLDYLRTGELKTIEDISSGVESIPSAFVGLFKGDNIGKKVIIFVRFCFDTFQAIDGAVIGKVVASGNAKFQKDDLVLGVFTWAQYSLVKEGSILRKLESSEFPLSYYLGVLGFNGLSAYAGFFELCKPLKGEKVFVSAAGGAVGNLVGQYAKLLGCYVVGCAGTQKKVELLKKELGFDEAFNYKEEKDLNYALKRYFPDGIDVYFDNVGGETLEAAVANMRIFGRVAVCGVISEYSSAGRKASPNMLDIVYKRISIRGFLAADFLNVFEDFFSKTLDYLRTGELKTIEDISSGVESIPSAFVGLFKGDNIGKKVISLAED